MECANVFETPKKRKAVECAGGDPDTPKSLVELREEKDFAKEIQKKRGPDINVVEIGATEQKNRQYKFILITQARILSMACCVRGKLCGNGSVMIGQKRIDAAYRNFRKDIGRR